LVGIEPASMTAVFCENTADRKAETWEKHLAPFDRVEFIVSDAAKGIAKAVELVAAARRDDPQAPTLEHGLDVFHTTMEAQRILAQEWRPVEAAWEKAESADVKVAESKQQGIDARSVSGPARAAWTQAVEAFERFEHREAAWERAHAALDLFDADGRLNDRCRAEMEITEALKGLTDPEWSKVRNFLKDPRSLSFLDRMQRRLEEAEPRPEWREAMAWRWWLRHRRPRSSDRLTNLVRTAGRDNVLNESEQISYDRVAAVLGDTFRASSAVECMNSVLRMQQSRHRRMTQPMLDLKRLYWNCHRFRSGPRKDVCPYQKLGLQLPTFDFWELLRTDPANLTQTLSTSENAE
jgi:hypothetical protein